MGTVIDQLAEFTASTCLETLPAGVVEECKRVLLDSIGCALGGHSHPKGTIALDYARQLGPGVAGAQASVLGSQDRLSAAAAAFANSELINALDFDAILPPGHVSPYVIPGALAAAEAAGASGAQLLSALAVGHEISNRMGKGLDYLRDVKDGKPAPPPVHGYASTIFGATAAISKVRSHARQLGAHAMAIAASMAPMNAQWSWSMHVPTASIKYAVGGALVQAAWTGAALAELGHTGDRRLLDDAGFGWARMSGSSRWEPDSVLPGLGRDWGFPAEQTYKPYPHCRSQHGPMQLVRELVAEHGLRPAEITRIHAWVEGHVMHELWLNRTIDHVTIGQFSVAHGLAMAAHMFPPDKSWQSPDRVFDPSVLALMDKVSFEAHPDYAKLLLSNAASRPARVEISARGQRYVAERRWAKGTPSPDPATFMSNDELSQKFIGNAQGVLPLSQAAQAVDCIWRLESVRNVEELMVLLTP
jgi:2-methylcitrate dehydratase PrpD